MQDPEAGWDNPSEQKAQKLARSATRGLVDRNLKPDTEERRRINTLLLYPPNRCCTRHVGLLAVRAGDFN